MEECNHTTEIWSIYDGGVSLFKADGTHEDKEYTGYVCEFCPECGQQINPERKFSCFE